MLTACFSALRICCTRCNYALKTNRLPEETCRAFGHGPRQEISSASEASGREHSRVLYPSCAASGPEFNLLNLRPQLRARQRPPCNNESFYQAEKGMWDYLLTTMRVGPAGETPWPLVDGRKLVSPLNCSVRVCARHRSCQHSSVNRRCLTAQTRELALPCARSRMLASIRAWPQQRGHHPAGALNLSSTRS